MAVGAAALPASALAAPQAESAPETSPAYYPPALTGLRGSHPGSFETAHSLRDGTFWEMAGKPSDTGESYDLVVVGGGISGLSAAHFFRKLSGPKARVLILENHDDFGGHAKRNEFRANRFLLGYGGTFSIESPEPYSAVARGLIEELGIDVPSYPRHLDKNLYRSLGLQPMIFFDKETFGADRLVVDPEPIVSSETGDQGSDRAENWKKFLAQAPLSDNAKRDVQRFFHDRKDYLPSLSSDEKKARFARMSYAKFLTEIVGVDPQVVQLYQAIPQPIFGLGIDAVSAQDAWGLGYPGFQGMNLDPAPGHGMNRDAIPNAEADKYFFHFPDGNASIARLLVRNLIPESVPGNSADDVVLARTNYSKLDVASSPVRIRLNSTVVRVRHAGDPASAKEVIVDYASGGKVHTVRAAHCILACWHVVIPYICGELPQNQKDALASAAKVPLLYTNVAIEKLGISPEARGQLRLLSGKLSHHGDSRSARQHRRL